MTNTEVSDFLEHHGILGMKWGVRKNRDRVDTRPQRESGVKAKPRKKSKLTKDQKSLVNLAVGITTYTAVRYGSGPAIRAGRNFLVRNPYLFKKIPYAAITSAPNYAQGFKFVNSVLRNGSKVRVLIPKV